MNTYIHRVETLGKTVPEELRAKIVRHILFTQSPGKSEAFRVFAQVPGSLLS